MPVHPRRWPGRVPIGNSGSITLIQEARAPRPRLSVTVLNYNYARYLPSCIESILEQTFADFELVIIDDCSTDDSEEILRKYAGDRRVRIIRHESNRGYVASLIEGAEANPATELLTVVSADDMVVDREAFARQVAALDQTPAAAFCFSAYWTVDADGVVGVTVQAPLSDAEAVPGQKFLAYYLTRTGMHVLHTGAVIRRSAYERAGRYRPDLRYAVDFAMWGMLALEGDAVYRSAPLYGYRVHRGQMSKSLAGVKKTLREVLSSIDAVFDKAGERQLALSVSRGQAIRFHLFSEALPDAFKGDRWMALRRVAAALSVRPLQALRSRALAETILVVCFGTRGHGFVRSLVRSVPWLGAALLPTDLVANS